MIIFVVLIGHILSVALNNYKPHYHHSYSEPKKSTIHIAYSRIYHGLTNFLVSQNNMLWQQDILYITNCTSPRIHQKVLHLRNQFNNESFARDDEDIENLMILFSIEDYGFEDQSYLMLDLKQMKVKHINQSKTIQYNLMFFLNQKHIQPSQFQQKEIRISYQMFNYSKGKTWYLPYILKHKLRHISYNFYQFQNHTLDKTNAIAFTIHYQNYDNNLFQFLIHPQQKNITSLNQNPSTLLLNQKKRIKKPIYSCAEDSYNNLIKGMSYSYGSLRIINDQQVISNQPKSILSLSPSRTRFPWSFLWDDGFHLQVVVRKNKQLAFEILKSWLNTEMDGWISRQQNRGKQRNFLCSCPSFMNTDIKDGNPPTLILMIEYLIQNNPQFLKSEFSQQLYSKLQKWFVWYVKTQGSSKVSFGFKWYDHISSQGSFNSGMDDFPRIPLNHKYQYESILNIDCQSWMYYFSVVMQKLNRLLKAQELFTIKIKQLKQKINQTMHKMFVDQNGILKDLIFNKKRQKVQFSQHIGYPNILPLAFGMLYPGSKTFNSTLNLITNQRILNTSFGLSSISQQSFLYNKNSQSYWRGPIWLNINYLVLKGLKKYYPMYKKEYSNLKKDLIETVCTNWQQTGYFFQNYNSMKDGKGSFSYPFNGWTSLITNIIQQNY